MVQGARRMEALLKDLLDYTQVVSGDDARDGAADAGLILEYVVQNLGNTIAESQAEVTGEELPVLAVKEVHLLQLLQNLIGNALKYRGPDRPQIRITAVPEGDMWRFSVRDNGIGIAPQYTRQVFGLFKRLHGDSRYPGTGIGLAICQKIVERYGGRIWVESEGDGKGSNFLFTLPGS
jgi:light-regulated signal transduction histidine kinase (bacteriophytochrome)